MTDATPAAPLRQDGGIPDMSPGWLVALSGLVAMMFLLNHGTYDLGVWERWGEQAHALGMVAAYEMNRGDNYPPLPLVFFGTSHYLALLLGLAPIYLLKTSLLLFVLAGTWQVYGWSGRHWPTTALFYFPAVYSALALSYIDVYFVPPLLLALRCLQQGKVRTFSFWFSLACFTKFIPLVMAPFLAVYVLSLYCRRDGALRGIPRALRDTLLPAAGVILAFYLVFGTAPLDAMQNALEQRWLSAMALNFNWVVTRVSLQWLGAVPRPMDLNPFFAMIDPASDAQYYLAKGLFWSSYLLVFVTFIRRAARFEHLLAASGLGCFAYFIFNTGAHENHLFLTALLTTALACCTRHCLQAALLANLASSINLFLFFGTHGGTPGVLYHTDIVDAGYAIYRDMPLLMASFNTLYFVALAWRWCRTYAAPCTANTA